MNFQITESKILKDIPSASGIVELGEKFYVVGDDSPYLFCLDRNFREISRTKIFSAEKLKAHRISKEHKPDFEAMEKISENEIAIFGSGSRSPERDYFVRVLFGEDIQVKVHLISDFYEYLKSLPLFEGTEFNIEAAAEYRGKLVLFNRRRNLVITFNYKDFVEYLEADAPLPEIEVKEVKLPEINGIEAGFSGATAFQNKPLLIITASVEDTDNAYDDGAILGSFIGLVDMDSGEIVGELQPILSPEKKDGPIKVESVAIEKVISKNELQLILTTDSDGGDSLIIRADLSLESL